MRKYEGVRKDDHLLPAGGKHSVHAGSRDCGELSRHGEDTAVALSEREAPRLIDEWQVAPMLWDAVIFEVNKHSEPGQFILTGSAVPRDDAVMHTGTGRIARVTMRPMSLFESLCVRDLRAYSSAIDGEVFHFRDRTGLEVDAIVRLRDGRWGAVEVKLGGRSNIEEGCAHLLESDRRVDTSVTRATSFKMVLTGGKVAYRREDKIFVVLVGCLRP